MEIEMRDKFLPVGSVVLLKGGTKRAMIIGFCAIAIEDKTKVFDYSGCIYPEGYLNSNEVCLFNHDQIDKIYSVGYECEEEKKFKDSLSKIIDKYNNDELDISNEENSDYANDDVEIIDSKEENNNKFIDTNINDDLEHL